MLRALCNYVMYSATILSLFLIDHYLGKGFANTCQKVFCKVFCFVRRTIREEQRRQQLGEVGTFSLPVLVTEIMFLGLAIAFLNKYKQNGSTDRIDELLKESRETLRQTNEFLEQWRLRRVPSEYMYLDDEPEEIKPFDLEAPIFHMAIIDTLGTARSQPESGDAGDPVNDTHSTLLSMTSMLDDEFESMSDVPNDENIEEVNNIDYRHRILWDVIEEDGCYLDE